MLSQIAKNLELGIEPRKLIASVSGGLDSTVLLYLLKQLSKEFKIQLSVFHVNFQLRGRASDDDEVFVRKLAKSMDLPFYSHRVNIDGKTGVQEKARSLRLSILKELPVGEVVEAHHADDQVETFLFRLFRGAGLHGLSGIQMRSEREGRKIWRPLLSFTKDELLKFARSKKIHFRKDASNKTLKYDRNWIRNKALPLISERFPKAREAILRTMEQIREETPQKIPSAENIILDNGWRWTPLMELPKADLQRWVHSYFRNELKIFLSRSHIVELSDKISAGKAFSFNAPKDLILRGRLRSRSINEPKVLFIRKQG